MLEKRLDFSTTVFQQRKHIPVVLTKDEVQSVILNMNGIYQLMTKLMYGCGLRMSEVQNIRIKDIDFGFEQNRSASS